MNELGYVALLVRVGRTRELRRVMLAYAGFSISEYATWLAVLFFALERGGPSEVGLVAFLLLVPAVLVTPFASYAGDRFRPQRALAGGLRGAVRRHGRRRRRDAVRATGCSCTPRVPSLPRRSPSPAR